MGKTVNNLMNVAAMVAVICLVRVAAAAPAVQVWSQAVVQADRVRLADMASVNDLDAEQAKTLLAVEVCDAPAPGAFANVDIERIRKALAEAQVNLASLCITGSAECRVFHPAEPAGEKTAARDNSAYQSQPAQAGPQTVEAAVRDYLNTRLSGLEGRPEIRFAAANRTFLGLAGKDMTFRVRSRGNALLGLITLDVDVVEADKVGRTIPVLAEVALFKSVVVAMRPVNRSSAIRAEDINLQERRFTRAEDIGLGNVALAVNRQACRYIDRGEMVGTRDVQALPLVRRGESVTVWFKRGGLSICSSAKALKEGSQGERIEVKAEPGGQVYSVVVTGLKTVEAESGNPAQQGPAQAQRLVSGSNNS